MLRSREMPDRSIRTSAPPGLTFRRITEADMPFLAELYASTRRDELAPVPWSDEQKGAFLQSQFDLQHRYYQEHYTSAEFLVIEVNGPERATPIGRLYVDRWPDQIRLVDIAIVPTHRRQGVGTALLRQLMREGADGALALSIHVEHNNPAMRLYERLGFWHVDTNGVYHLMRWEPGVRPVTG